MRAACQARKGNTNTIFWVPISFAGVGVLLREGLGVTKFGMSIKVQVTQTFWWDILEVCWEIPGMPKKFENKQFVFNLWPLALTKVLS